MHSSFVSIRIINFTFFSSSICILPYLSTHYLNYTSATCGDYGKIRLLSSMLGAIVCLAARSVADSGRAYKLACIGSLVLSLVSFAALSAPILFVATNQGYMATESIVVNGSPFILTGTVYQGLTKATDVMNHTQESTQNEQIEPQMQEAHESDSTNHPKNSTNWWSYLLSLCIIVGTTAQIFAGTFIDLITIRMANQRDTNYSSVRLWGGLGALTTSLLLSFVANDVQWLTEEEFISLPMSIYLVMVVFTLVIISFMPSTCMFDFEKKLPPAQEVDKLFSGCEFKFTRKLCLPGGKKTLRGCEAETRINSISLGVRPAKNEGVELTKIDVTLQFDTRDEEIYRNIRRCSLAPLGDSILVKQFELDGKKLKHFKYVTKFEPMEKNPSEGRCPMAQMPAMEYVVNCGEGNKIDGLTGYYQEDDDTTGIWLVTKSIIRSKELVTRLLIPLVVNGFLAAMNEYLFPYVNALDDMKFRPLAANAILCGQLSETFFYHISPHFIKSISQLSAMNLILFAYGIRYSLYLTFALYGNEILPLGLITTVELLAAVTSGWFTCMMNELVLEYVIEKGEYLPESIKSTDKIGNTKEPINRTKHRVRVLIALVLSCCFRATSFGLGSLFGGLLIDNFGFKTFWIVSTSLAYSLTLAQCLIAMVAVEK